MPIMQDAALLALRCMIKLAQQRALTPRLDASGRGGVRNYRPKALQSA
jgi:hypothetical protein